MAHPLPNLRAGSGQLLFGTTRTVRCLTTVQIFWNGTEQRAVAAPPFVDFSVPLTLLVGTEAISGSTSWQTFFNTVQGRLDQDLSITIGSTTYSHLTLLTDVLEITTDRPITYNLQVSLRQTLNFGYSIPSVGSTYPTFSGGTVAQYPFTQGIQQLTSVNDSAYGQHYSKAWYGASISGFPTTSLKRWRLDYPVMQDADVATLEQFFLGNQGRYQTFSFVNPLDSVTYPNVRFDNDTLQITYNNPNQSHVSVGLIQTFV